MGRKTGTEFDDTLRGLGGDDTLIGLAGDDSLNGGRYGVDSLDGGDGNDILVLGNDGGTILGGAGNDRAEITVSDAITAITADGGSGSDLLQLTVATLEAPIIFALRDASVTSGIALEAVGFDKLIYVSDVLNTDSITGGDRADFISTADFSDTQYHDRLDGGAGNDTLRSDGDCTLLGGDGDDLLIAGGIDALRDTGKLVIGGTGIDTLQLSLNATSAVTVSVAELRNGFELRPGIEFDGIERVNLFGSIFGDSLGGGSFGDTMDGSGGNDTLLGNGGNDDLTGGADADSIGGGVGDDRLFGGSENDGLFGGDGRDRLEGGFGTDLIYGGTGIDSLYGGDDADLLSGGAGSDFLNGGAGEDQFLFRAPVAGEFDLIRDFEIGVDQVRLGFGDMARGALAEGDFVLGNATHDESDRIVYDQAKGNIWYDADGKAGVAAVLFAHVTPGLALTAADFFVI